MSTKIFTGFKVETNDLYKIRELVRSIVPEITRRQEDGFRRWMEAQRKRNPNEDPFDLVRRFWEITEERRAKRFVERDPLIDLDFDIVFIPSVRHTYGMTFTEHGAWHQLWMAVPGVIEYGYWDNTDQPEHLLNGQWAQRGLRWARLLPGVTTPAQAGFTFRVGNLDLVKTMEITHEILEQEKAKATGTAQPRRQRGQNREVPTQNHSR